MMRKKHKDTVLKSTRLVKFKSQVGGHRDGRKVNKYREFAGENHRSTDYGKTILAAFPLTFHVCPLKTWE